MLLLVLSLEAVTTIASRPALPRPVLRMSSNACSENTACTVDPDDRYRVSAESEPLLDRKDRALVGYWKNCGVTGMPVCPGRGKVKYSTPLD